MTMLAAMPGSLSLSQTADLTAALAPMGHALGVLTVVAAIIMVASRAPRGAWWPTGGRTARHARGAWTVDVLET